MDLIRCSLGRIGEEGVLQRDDEELVALAVADLAEATGAQGPPLDTRVTRWGGALPQYTVGHLDRVAAIRAGVAALPGLAVCGAAFDGIGIPACIGTARSAAEGTVSYLRARSRPAAAQPHELTDLLPVRVVGEQHLDAITAGSRGEERVADGQQRLAFVWVGTQHEQRDGLAGRVLHGHEQAERPPPDVERLRRRSRLS